MAPTKLGLDGAESETPPATKPKRTRRRPPSRPAPPAPPAERVPWWKRRGPLIDRIWITLLLFGGLLAASMHIANLEVQWNAAIPGSGDAYNEMHRLAQVGAGTLFLWMLIAIYDMLGVRCVTFGEALRNMPNPGREGIFIPMSPEAQAATIRYYGNLYAAAPIAAAIAWG